MFSINNNSKFENFTELINEAFKARSKESLIEILYHYLPKVFGGDVLIFLPDLLQSDEVELQTHKIKEFTREEQKLALKIKEYYKAEDVSDKPKYPVVIDGWYITVLKIKSETIFLFAVENSAMEKLRLHGEDKENILSVVASLLFRIDALEDESQRTIKSEKEKLRTQILSSVSHDLKTPLAAIIGSLNILTSMNAKISESQRKDLIETAVSEAHRLNNFITNILNMARVESGVVKAKMEWCNLGDIINPIRKKFRMKYPDRTLSISEFPEYISFNIDPVLFEQMIMNIIDNAVKYSPAETDVELIIEKNTSLDILIRNHGKNIPEDMLEKIFDKYTRLQLADRKVAGTGLGLAITKVLASLQNINISAHNQGNDGVVFKISCPEWKR